MIHVVAYDRRAAERDAIRSSLWKKIERLPEEDMEFREANSSELLTALEERNDPDLLYYEFLKGQTVTELRSLRKRCENALLMLIADAVVSPLEYLKPGIAPDSLLLRPYTKEMLSEINGEFVQTHLDRAEEDDGEKFMVETKSGKVFISYSKIFYFEARDKKLFGAVIAVTSSMSEKSPGWPMPTMKSRWATGSLCRSRDGIRRSSGRSDEKAGLRRKNGQIFIFN